jgi:phosphate-selective porin OprO/OprP
MLCAAVCAIAGGLAFGQQPSRQDAPWPLTASPAGDAAARADEINNLRGAIRQLQERLDRLSPDAAGPGAWPVPAMFPLADKPVNIECFNAFAPFATPAPSTQETDSRWAMNGNWKDGLVLQSKDGDFRVHVGGRLEFDYGWNMANKTVQFGPGGIGELEDGALFRRARIQIDGTLYQHFEFMAEFDFANSIENDDEPSAQTVGSPSFTNVWIGVKDLPVLGTLRVGWMKEPLGFEHLTGSNWYNFMERSPGSDSLSATSPGVLVRNHTPDERMTWWLGVFHAQNDNFGFGVGDGQYAYTGRITWLPWYENEGEELLHLGVGASHRHLANDQITLHGRPSVRTEPGALLPALADTGTIGGTSADVLDAELVAVHGSWTLQSEYYCGFIHDAVVPNEPPPEGVLLGTLFYQGAYVQMLYFLTGEHQAYDRQTATFDRVVPVRNFNIWDGEHGLGAWQIGLRYGYLDLQNKGVNGATLNDLTLGLNWFLNPNMKLQWNLAVDHRESTPAGSSGWTTVVGGRVAIVF